MLSDFFIATPQGIEKADTGDSFGNLPKVYAKNIDPVKLATLQNIIFETDLDEEMQEINENPVREFEREDAWVYLVNPELAKALAKLSPEETRRVASEWADTEEWQASNGTEEELHKLLQDLTVFVQRNLTKGKSLYLFMSL